MGGNRGGRVKVGLLVCGLIFGAEVIRGQGLDPAAFSRAWQQALDQHAVLRSSFIWEDLEEPLQVVWGRVPLPWEEHDLRGGGDGFVELTADQRVVARRRRVDRPEQARTQQRGCTLVDPDRMLERDRRIGDNEDGGECDQQDRVSSSGVSD